MRRPPGYGRSTFLSLVAEMHDVHARDREPNMGKSPYAGFQPHKLRFEPHSSAVLLLDMRQLNFSTIEAMKESLERLLQDSTAALTKKYQLMVADDLEMLPYPTGSALLNVVIVRNFLALFTSS